MRPRVTNKDAGAFDAYYLSFESAGALEFVNEYSGLAATTGYLYRLRRTRARISGL
jgi:hypothetical protein